jgi:uncharacterized DUF497 family protein
MRFTWSETKRKSNIEKHGFNLADVPQVFAGPTFTYEDARLDYSEQRFVTLGLLGGVWLLSSTPKVHV